MISINDNFGDNDSSFTSVSQQVDDTKAAVKKPISEVMPFKETFLNETFADEKKDLKMQAASTQLAKGQAEAEEVRQQLKAKRKDANMKQFDEAAKDCLKAMKRSKNVFETVYDDFSAIAAASDNLESSTSEFGAFLDNVERFFDLKK